MFTHDSCSVWCSTCIQQKPRAMTSRHVNPHVTRHARTQVGCTHGTPQVGQRFIARTELVTHSSSWGLCFRRGCGESAGLAPRRWRITRVHCGKRQTRATATTATATSASGARKMRLVAFLRLCRTPSTSTATRDDSKTTRRTSCTGASRCSIIACGISRHTMPPQQPSRWLLLLRVLPTPRQRTRHPPAWQRQLRAVVAAAPHFLPCVRS